MKTQTVFGDFAVDDRGFQVAHKADHHPVAGWQVGSGLARRSGHEQASVPDPAVEPAVTLLRTTSLRSRGCN